MNNTISLRQICDEAYARELLHDFDATMVEIQHIKKDRGILSITMQDHVLVCARDLRRKDLSVQVHLQCSDLTAQRLYKHFTSASDNNDHAHQIIPNYYLVQPVCDDDTHQPRHNAV